MDPVPVAELTYADFKGSSGDCLSAQWSLWEILWLLHRDVFLANVTCLILETLPLLIEFLLCFQISGAVWQKMRVTGL